MDTIKSKTAADIHELAEQVSNMFERKTRKDDQEFWTLKDGSPEWVSKMIREAHGDMLPDDWRYEFIVECLDAIAGHKSVEMARDEMEADIYTNDLTGWLHSRNDRPGYVDQAMEEFGMEKVDTIGAISAGQLMEKLEVFDAVLSHLENVMEEIEEEQEEEENGK